MNTRNTGCDKKEKSLDQEKNCKNHPERKALSFCHYCKDWFCRECLQDGKEYYYCRKPQCNEAFKKETETTWEVPRPNPNSESWDDLVTIAYYRNDYEAHLARTKLESEGIMGYLFNEIRSAYHSASGDILLQTRKSDVEKALQILNQIPS